MGLDLKGNTGFCILQNDHSLEASRLSIYCLLHNIPLKKVAIGENYSYKSIPCGSVEWCLWSLRKDIISLSDLKQENFYYLKYFWWLFIPGLNIVSMIVASVVGLIELSTRTYNHYASIYKEQSEKELQNILQHMIDNSKRANEKLREFKSSCNIDTDKKVLTLMSQHQQMIEILKG